MFFLKGNSLWSLVQQSDTTSKIVLLVLLAMSIICWTVFFCKLIILRIKKKQLDTVKTALHHAHTVEQLVALASENKETVPGYFIARVMAVLQKILKARQADAQRNSERDVQVMQLTIDQTLDHMVADQESYLPFLSTSAALAPLLGLFGTVWGLVHAFVRISEEQVASINTVAPGIAEALITTLAGLLVAIPALAMYNYLAVQVREIERRLLLIADILSFTTQSLLP